MNELLLILVLFGNPASQAHADALATDLRAAYPARVVVVAGAEAWTRARALGADEAGLAATAGLERTRDGKLVLVRVEEIAARGAPTIETTVWALGHRDRHAAIDAQDVAGRFRAGALALVRQRVDPLLDGPEAQAARLVQPFLERADWAGLVAALPADAQRTPWHRLHAIRALLRLGDSDGAQAELARMQAQDAASPALAHARELIEHAGEPQAAESDPGNTLR